MFNRNNINDSAVSVITQIPRLKNLKLPDNQITVKGFLKMLALKELEDLDLRHSYLSTQILPQSASKS
jgi:hypothetical protein